MLEVTADSNIYVSALEFAGTPLRFLEMARSGTFQLAISDWIVAEVARTLRTKFLWDEHRLTDAIASIADFTVRVNPPQTLSVVKEDPDDDRILECAIAANARFIVTGDNALLRLGSYRGIHILKAANFLQLLDLPKTTG